MSRRKPKPHRYGPVPAPYWDKEHQIQRIPARPDDAPGECPHPPTHTWGWFAADGTFCAACCACGAVLLGGAELPPTEGGEPA